VVVGGCAGAPASRGQRGRDRERRGRQLVKFNFFTRSFKHRAFISNGYGVFGPGWCGPRNSVHLASYGKEVSRMSVALLQSRANLSIDTDPQQQEAASPQMLVVRSFLRYAAGRSV
jgi:hypothetical protein